VLFTSTGQRELRTRTSSIVGAGLERFAPRFVLATVLAGASIAGAGGCGSRSGLYLPDVDAGVDEGPCEDGAVEACGSAVGACQEGTRTCVDERFGPCEGERGPTKETCNDIDDDCDGKVDEDFGVGDACDGPDSDLCLDDVKSCSGCSRGPDLLETCNGVDDDCDGIVDADCDSGDCAPKLLVTGSVPSSPSCVDFPVEPGSFGGIQYPCGGGPVTAQLGSVMFTGSVSGGTVSLTGTEIIGRDRSPDGCVWQMTHHITGSVGSGSLDYAYEEIFVEGEACWFPCTETGTVEIQWVP
jgi:hypothetical protein